MTWQMSLPETASLSSVPDFAECFLSDTRQRGYLPSAREKALGKQLALGKEVVCREPSTRQTITLGKTGFAECYSPDTWQRATAVNGRQPPLILCRVSSPDTWQRDSFAECQKNITRQTIFFSLLTSKFFLHSTKRLLCRVSKNITRQTIFFSLLTSKFFLQSSDNT